MNKTAILGGTVILGLSLVFAACNNNATIQPIDNGTGGNGGNADAVACTIKVITNNLGFAYSPDKCEIKVGQKVSIEASSSHPLYATASGSTIPTDIDSALAPTSGSVVVTFTNAGSFGIRCKFHSTMVGTITVTN
jgi:plastocyanin